MPGKIALAHNNFPKFHILYSYASYALAFWYGIKLIIQGREALCKSEKPEYGADNMITVRVDI